MKYVVNELYNEMAKNLKSSILISLIIDHNLFNFVFRIREDGYLESDPHYDVSLLELESHVKPSLYISPICLPGLDFFLRIRVYISFCV